MICPKMGVKKCLPWLAPLLFCGLALGQNAGLRVTDPIPSRDGSIVTSEPAIYLRGTLSSRGEDRRVLWESSRGFSDLATVPRADNGTYRSLEHRLSGSVASRNQPYTDQGA